MAKKTSLKESSEQDLHRLVASKQEELRALRFSIAGSKNRNVKLFRTLRHDIARGLTELSVRKIADTK